MLIECNIIQDKLFRIKQQIQNSI